MVSKSRKVLLAFGLIVIALFAVYYVGSYWGITCHRPERQALYEIKHYKQTRVRAFGDWWTGGCYASFSASEDEKDAITKWYEAEVAEHSWTRTEGDMFSFAKRGDVTFELHFNTSKKNELIVYVNPVL